MTQANIRGMPTPIYGDTAGSKQVILQGVYLNETAGASATITGAARFPYRVGGMVSADSVAAALAWKGLRALRDNPTIARRRLWRWLWP